MTTGPAQVTDARRRLLFWSPAMFGGVALVAAVVALAMLYETALEESRAELRDAVDHQARLIGTIDRANQGDAAKTLKLVREAEARHENVRGASQFTVAMRDGDKIQYLLRPGYDDSERPLTVPFDSEVAEPMRRALRGESGTLIGPDYQGVTVLAAYEPIRASNWGVVARIDMSEVRRPFLRTAAIVLAIVGFLVAGAIFGSFRLMRPVIRDLERSRDAAEAANRAKSEFLAAMSHELRTPLNAIVGFSQGLLERADRQPLSDHQKDRLEKVHKSGLHLLSLINDVLDIARVESGRMDVNLSICNPTVVLADVRDFAMGLIRNKPGLALQVDAALDLPLMTTDTDKVKQILINLVGNAVKFTDKGQITLSAWEENGCIAFSVADTGVGIPENQLERVFEKLYQIRQATPESIKGTGLGLAIAREYAELLGGSITVTSELGRGSTFTLRLPQRVSVKQESVEEPVLSGSP